MIAPPMDPRFQHLLLVLGCYECLRQEVSSVRSHFGSVSGEAVCLLISGYACVAWYPADGYQGFFHFV